MGQKIVNNLENTITEGNYTGGNSTVNIYYNNQQKEDTKKSNGNKTIFLSYNWHDKEIADKIDKHLSGLTGITVKRDIRDIGSWKSIRKFMEGIRQQDYAVLIISGLYLKSKNCMFEVMEIMKEQQYRERIFPAVVEYGIYDPLTRAEYIKYWQHECDKLEASLKGLEPEYISGLAADLRQYKSIASSIGEFLNMVADMNNPDIQEVELQIEKAILKDR
ncbi:MAG: toll/interleukin-1 receptor domain-containing protein [Lachnospiraceae bacterium]|nr:toll/interleukin-1 receptor domain-containing protein [Lachnospiraceae bacterium]